MSDQEEKSEVCFEDCARWAAQLSPLQLTQASMRGTTLLCDQEQYARAAVMHELGQRYLDLLAEKEGADA